LKTKSDALSSDPGTYDVLNFWRFLPCEKSPELRKFAPFIPEPSLENTKIGGCMLKQGGLTHENLIKTPLIYKVS